MKEFEPSADFVSKVMRNISAYEAARSGRKAGSTLWRTICVSRPFRYMISCYGVLAGIFFIPATCL